MTADLVLRFVIGGVAVSLFATLGECLEPQTFAGLFGTAPSVALATLGIAFARGGAGEAARDARWMALACVALAAYCAACIAACRRRGVPVWLGAFGAWLVWLALALALHAAAGLAARLA